MENKPTLTPFITEQKRTKTNFEKKYLEAFGNRQERRLDLPGFSPALVSKKQELEHIQQKLADERLNYEYWLQEYDHRLTDINNRRRLHEEEEKIHNQFNKQAQDDIKRTKNNIEKEFQLATKLEKELSALLLKEQQLDEKLKALRSQIEYYKPCADFLEDIVLSTKMFETPEAVLSRYQALTATKRDWSVALHDELRMDDKFTQKKAQLAFLKNQLIERNHKLVVLREEQDKKIKEKRYKQISVIKIAERTDEKKAEIATINTSINSICRQIIQNPIQPIRSHMTKQQFPTTVEGKLDIIKNRFLDLVEVVGDPEAAKLVRIDEELKDFLKATRKANENQSRFSSPKKAIKDLTIPPKNDLEKDNFDQTQNENSILEK